MNKLLAALVAATFATSGFAASHAKEEKKDAKPAAAAASAAAKKDEKKKYATSDLLQAKAGAASSCLRRFCRGHEHRRHPRPASAPG